MGAKNEYEMTCANCGNQFIGRSNQRFCGTDCKTSFNNRKAAQLRMEMPDIQKIRKNFLILKDMYPESKGEIPIAVDTLLRAGFDFEAPTRKIKTRINGFICYMINGYAFRIINQNKIQLILIYREQDLNTI